MGGEKGQNFKKYSLYFEACKWMFTEHLFYLPWFNYKVIFLYIEAVWSKTNENFGFI